MVGYIAFTMTVTEWRLKFRRRMNESDQEANTKAIDSLLNFETVKYFGNEAHEARRYDRGLETYMEAAVRSRTSLSLLNIGQAADHRGRPDRGDVDGGDPDRRWRDDRGRVRGGQYLPDAALPAAQLLRLRVSRDQGSRR